MIDCKGEQQATVTNFKTVYTLYEIGLFDNFSIYLHLQARGKGR